MKVKRHTRTQKYRIPGHWCTSSTTVTRTRVPGYPVHKSTRVPVGTTRNLIHLTTARCASYYTSRFAPAPALRARVYVCFTTHALQPARDAREALCPTSAPRSLHRLASFRTLLRKPQRHCPSRACPLWGPVDSEMFPSRSLQCCPSRLTLYCCTRGQARHAALGKG